MNELIYIYKIINLLKIIIMLLIKYVLSYDFVRKNFLKKLILKTLFKLPLDRTL
jgi:hypothetical protein